MDGTPVVVDASQQWIHHRLILASAQGYHGWLSIAANA
jgi:hypothetical protein